MKTKKLSDITKMLIAMILGSLFGIIVGEPATHLGFIGDIWLNLMKMFLVPIVVCMLVKGISSMDSPQALGRIGLKIVAFYVCTTVLASVLGIGITSVLKPGVGFTYEIASETAEIASMPSIAEFFKSMFSSNIFKSFSEGNMMHVLIISCIIGVAIVLLPEGKREPVRDWFVAMSDLVMSVIKIALYLAPIGVFCLMASSLGKYGVGLLVTMAKILGTFYLTCGIHLILVYCVILWLFTGISPVAFLKKAFPTFATAASTCSSNAVIPVSMDVALKNFDCDESVAGLGIPLGATINKDGVAILCGSVLIFSAQAMGIALTPQMLINLIFVTTLVTSAGSGVPGGGLMNLMIVATAIGMPLDIVVMVGGFYRFFDMGTTSMNCLGDMSATVIVDRLEKRRAARLAKSKGVSEKMSMKLHRTCWLEIDLGHIKDNFKKIQEMVGERVTVMPAVKANAYGHGVIMAVKALEEAGAKVIAVGNIDEAIKLREAGVKTNIVVFASNLISEVADLYVRYHLTPTVMYRFQAEAISKAATEETGIFVKIETGRGRLGINSDECADAVREMAALPNIRIDGLYSHMAYAGWDESKKDYPQWQYDRFRKALDQMESYGIHIPFAQLVNTPGSIAYPDIRLTGACPGRGIWGYSPLERRAGHPDLKEALLSWKSRLLIVKEVTGGKLGPNFEAVKLDEPKRIGILAGGVSDGINHKQAKGGTVLFHGKRVPICSPMSLEHMTIDLTDCPEAQAGDEVVILGKQGNEEITADELMALWGVNIPYFWTAIPEHLERVYFENDRPVAISRGYDVELL